MIPFHSSVAATSISFMPTMSSKDAIKDAKMLLLSQFPNTYIAVGILTVGILAVGILGLGIADSAS